jgi:hypothetical protein
MKTLKNAAVKLVLCSGLISNLACASVSSAAGTRIPSSQNEVNPSEESSTQLTSADQLDEKFKSSQATFEKDRLQDLKNDKSQIDQLIMGGNSGGGANSIDGHLIEDYIKSINSEATYKSKVRPFLQMLHAKLQSNETGEAAFGSNDWWHNEIQAVIDATPKELTWYFVPGKVKQLTETVTGLPFPSDQVAIQTPTGEVWVDETLFRSKKLSPKELENFQTSIILHEILLRAARKQDNLLASYLRNQSIGLKSQMQIMKQVRLSNHFLISNLAQVSPVQLWDALVSLQWFGFGDPVDPEM